MQRARTHSNPYETIRTACFLNRAAVKMANINKACNFMFTDWKNLDDELLYFADVCAGPGGFSEYILSRKKWHAKGFGFTLKCENDFKLDEFFAGPCVTFHPFYGSKDNGDVYDPRTGGHFVTKLFDLFTPFSVGLVYLMYRCFNSVCIFKPNSSRPANSERYLICKEKKVDTAAIMRYLFDVTVTLSHILTQKEDNDVTKLAPLNELEADESFMKYLRESNDTLGRRQIVNLLKIAAFRENPLLVESKQNGNAKVMYGALGFARQESHKTIQHKVREMLNNTTDFIDHDAHKLTKEIISSTILNQPYDWYWIPCGSGQYVDEDKIATFYLSLSRRRVYCYVRSQWEFVGNMKLELPFNTLVYAELMYESKWVGENIIKYRALHILDAYMLGVEDVSTRYITQRHKSKEIL